MSKWWLCQRRLHQQHQPRLRPQQRLHNLLQLLLCRLALGRRLWM